MPTYEYECEKCGNIFEEFQSITAEPLTECRNLECGGKVRRLFSPGAGFIFKGSGFYLTDYRSENYKQAAKKDSDKTSSSSDSKSTKSTKSDSSPSKSSSGSSSKSST